MQANGNATQWPDGYPGRIDAEEDIARGHCFLVSDDEEPLAVFSFAPGPDETYSKIDGAWHSGLRLVLLTLREAGVCACGE